MGNFLSFDKMITPTIIKIFFWIGILFVIIASFFMVGYGALSKSSSLVFVLIGIMNLFLGTLMVRIYCEMLIVIFKMQESLLQIRNHFQVKQNSTES